uniref:Uncharacterized protein n=1 Tax=Rhizophora mucronata TaxID=61149 RepID=A0A2P2N335_RHIMU
MKFSMQEDLLSQLLEAIEDVVLCFDLNLKEDVLSPPEEFTCSINGEQFSVL